MFCYAFLEACDRTGRTCHNIERRGHVKSYGKCRMDGVIVNPVYMGTL